VPEWAGWAGGPAWTRVTAAALVGLPVVGAVVVAVVAVRVVDTAAHRPARTVALGWAVVAAAAVAVVRLTLVDPFTDPGCWRFCGRNPLLVAGPAWAGAAEDVALAALAAVVAPLVVVLARAVPRSPAARVTAAGAAVLVAGAGMHAAHPGPASPAVAAAGAAGLLAGLALGRAWEWRMRRALRRLIEDLEAVPGPGALPRALAASVGDPDLRVLYWDAGRGTHLDGEGRPAPPPGSAAGPGRAVTTVVRDGAPVAAVVHRNDIEPTAVEQALGPAARLWLRNEQLRATTLAALDDLRASEARIAERSAEEQRRLERSLHDGAQQRVVGIALLVRALGRARDGDGDVPPAAADRMARCQALLDAVLDDLRGVVPAGIEAPRDDGDRAFGADAATGGVDP
ncbi:MAG TPA: histidine kinase, partial [Acidimicrobiales bacterium]